MVEVFHTPLPTYHLGKLGYRFAVKSVGCTKQTHRHLWLLAFFPRAVDARAFDDLRDVRKGADFGIHWHNCDVPDFMSAMPALQLAHQIHGAVFEQLLRVFPVVLLVVFDCGKVFPAQLEDYAIRFF